MKDGRKGERERERWEERGGGGEREDDTPSPVLFL